MKKLVYLLIAVSLMLALVPAAAFAHTEDEPFVTDLIAGGGNEKSAMDVGDVLVWNDGDYLYVKYLIVDQTPGDPRDNWCITETHLQVATSPGDIPQKNGNPIPGQFEYSMEHDCVTDYTYMIPLSWDPSTPLTIAAHAVVQMLGGLDGLAAALPDQVTMKVKYPYIGGPSYFPETTISGGTFLDGIYEGWCADTDQVIYENTNYTANVYSSYEALPAGVVEYPENLDLVNWIINQGFVGQPSICGDNYTYGDVQRAIWALIEDTQSTASLGPWSQCRVDEILAAAQANGEGFEPGCNDVVAIILVPWDGGAVQVIAAQVTLIGLGIPCETRDETAWGAGMDFPGKNWAMYFPYTVQELPPPPILVVSSSSLNFSGEGWGGWSCPPDHPNVIDGGVSKTNTQPFVPADYPVNQVAAVIGATLDGYTYPVFPHYTYGNWYPGETGWAVHNGGTAQSLYVYVYCVE